jgi:6-pyruvoyltetrahydropterin/6-carboxytetrahydropterin synthase
MSYGVRVARNRLRFSSAHMATFAGGCEPLHGHNYVVTVEVEGELAADSWVIDFGLLKRIARERCEAIDHKFLLQRRSTALLITEAETHWQITFGEHLRYIFPTRDVAVLPIDNSTAERLAEWFHAEIAAALREHGAQNIRHLRVEVEEAPGQTGWYEAPLG